MEPLLNFGGLHVGGEAFPEIALETLQTVFQVGKVARGAVLALCLQFAGLNQFLHRTGERAGLAGCNGFIDQIQHGNAGRLVFAPRSEPDQGGPLIIGHMGMLRPVIGQLPALLHGEGVGLLFKVVVILAANGGAVVLPVPVGDNELVAGVFNGLH